MRDYIEIGCSPVDEDCSQLGCDKYDFSKLNRMECKAYIGMLERKYGEPPHGCAFYSKANHHDFGTYYEVALGYDDADEKCVEYAWGKDDAPGPENGCDKWDDIAKKELGDEYFSELAKGKK